MSAINWKIVQARLGLKDDGIPGKGTYTGLFKHVANPKANPAVLASMGNALSKWGPKYGADASPDRLADFLGQGYAETGGFEKFQENLNYSAKRLTEVWPNRFPTLASAQPYAGNPQALANKVYGGRMGNVGPEDGWDCRGSGYLMLTGKSNWIESEKSLGIGLDTNPEMARVPALSVLIALDFFTRNGVWSSTDANNPTGARKKVNGGTHGLETVNLIRAKLLKLLR